MTKLGKRELDLTLAQPLSAVPDGFDEWGLELRNDGHTLHYVFDAGADNGIPTLLARLGERGIAFKDLESSKSSLEDIFVDLVGRR